MKYKSFILASVLGLTLLTTSCRDEFADINTDQSKITEANVPYLYTQAQIEFKPADYLFWFYNGSYTTKFVQAYVPTGGFKSDFNKMGATGDQGSQVIKVLRLVRDIDFTLSKMERKDAATYTQLRATLDPLLVFLGLFDTDLYGDMPFTEAAMAKYTNPMLLTPKYDHVSDLYSLWLTMLDNSLDKFLNKPAEAQASISSQDIIYKGDMAKWAKLTNSLKLKIAVRLLNQDKAKALKIAEEVAKSSAGVLDGASDDFLFNKATESSNTDQVYNFGDEVNSFGAPNKTVVDFMLKNKDPRVRFFYYKNKFNSKVVQAFFDANKALPAYVDANVNYEMVGGKKVFKSWKGMGEPWVRYYGIPADINASQQADKYGDYFDKTVWKLTHKDADIYFTPYSLFNEELVRGRVDFRLPVAPGDAVIEDKEDNPWYGMYMSSAEVNLYLAEFKLLGANLPKTAEEYYNKSLQFSVREYDRLASLNKIPYYGTTYDYDPFEKTINLADGEIEAMMATADYQLTGTAAEKLEKVYIQQYLNFMYNPTDQFVAVRRSGVPKVGSSLIAWQILAPSSEIPRRFEIALPNPTDLMYNIKKQSLVDQGFTGGQSISPSLLNSERVWQDKGAPNFGEGPK